MHARSSLQLSVAKIKLRTESDLPFLTLCPTGQRNPDLLWVLVPALLAFGRDCKPGTVPLRTDPQSYYSPLMLGS